MDYNQGLLSSFHRGDSKPHNESHRHILLSISLVIREEIQANGRLYHKIQDNHLTKRDQAAETGMAHDLCQILESWS